MAYPVLHSRTQTYHTVVTFVTTLIDDVSFFRSAHGRMTEYSQTMVTKLDFAAQVADSGYMAAITILPVIFMAGLTAVFFL